MNENVIKWVEALQSGDYKQGKYVLKKEDRYCCLGVACDLYSKEHSDFKIVSQEDCTFFGANSRGFSRGFGDSIFLPSEVQEWLGLADKYGNFDESSLMGMNDEGKSFEEIAEVILTSPEGLFVK